MHTHTTRSRPLGPDLAVMAGVIQVGLVLALFFLPLSETCIGFLSYPAQTLGCSYHSFLEVYGLSLDGPVLGLAVLFAAGLMLIGGSRIQYPDLRAVWPWLAIAVNGVGMLLARMVVVWFLPTTAGAVVAAILMWRALSPEEKAGWGRWRRRRGERRRYVSPYRRTDRPRRF
jgi:hypothetical protein